MKPQLLFFIGKGGVGKSTTSALTSVHLASHPHKTLLVSMDPAHNQRDIFDQNFSEKPMHVSEHLMVKEVDTDFWIEKYLKETTDQIKETYKYESAFNLQNYFNVLQFSPGLEEYALLLAFEDTLKKYGDQDFIVLDMAPTALTLRFFSLLPAYVFKLFGRDIIDAVRTELLPAAPGPTSARIIPPSRETMW